MADDQIRPVSASQWAKTWAEQYLEATDTADKREALRRYLEAVSIALEVAYPSPGFLSEPETFNKRPLRELQEFLRQIDNREKPALFQPPKLKGRPAQDRQSEFIYSQAAAAITVLMRRFSKSESEATKTIERALRKQGMPIPGRGHSVVEACSALQTWRDKVMSGEKSQRARTWYDDALFFTDLAKSENDVINQFLNPGQLPTDPLFGK